MNYLVAVDYCFVDRPGGMARVAWDIALLMRDRGHTVVLICMNGQSSRPTPETSEHDGIRVVRYCRPQLPSWHPARMERTIVSAAQITQKHLAATRWDIVHIHAPLTGAGVVRGLGDGPRCVYTFHSPVVLEQRINWAGAGPVGWLKLALGQGALKRLEGGVLRRCNAIHTLSEYARTQVQRFHGLGDRVTVVPHWRRSHFVRSMTKIEARQKLNWPSDDKILFTVRRHGPRYGIDVAIRAIAPLAAAGRCRFVIGGDGAQRPKNERLARALGCGDQVRFVGRLSDEDLLLAYQAADLFVLPTLALECFGLITIEAFSMGCPVLSTDAAAIPETMEPIMPEFIVPAGDVDALRAKVEDYLAGRIVPPSEKELVEYVAARFDASVVVPKLIALVETDNDAWPESQRPPARS